jgi:hypothetical protein
MMEFKDLYKKAEELSKSRAAAGKVSAVAFVFLKEAAIEGLSWLTAVNVYPIECKAGDPYGHFECHSETESAHENPETWVALITYDKTLSSEAQRFVQTKELMHIFDADEGLVQTAEEYRGFITEIELEPPADRSEAYTTENDAKWKALLCLCPAENRNRLVAKFHSGEISKYELALEFRIPESLVTSVVSSYYDDALIKYVGHEN